MIDFRYHLVSLVSVFLALAVGIALGAGPLKGPIGSALTSEVQSLRQAKVELRAELDTAEAAVQHRDDFASAITPTLVDKALTGGSVVLVTVPDTDTSGIKALTGALRTAGATVTGRVEIKPAWTASGSAQAREAAVAQLADQLPSTLSADAGTAEKLTALLAEALVTTEAVDAARTARTTTILSALADAGLISLDGDVTGPALEAVLLVPGVRKAVDGSSAAPATGPATGITWRNLAAALDTGSQGGVVLGPASAATAGGVVAAVRSDSTVAKAVSTVDTGTTPMGVIATVLALREQAGGGVGAYGFGDGATDALPAPVAAS